MNESRNRRKGGNSWGETISTDGGLPKDAQARIKGRDRDLRETQEQGVWPQEDIDRRNREEKKPFEELAKKQGKWIEEVNATFEKQYGAKISPHSRCLVKPYRKQVGIHAVA